MSFLRVCIGAHPKRGSGQIIILHTRPRNRCFLDDCVREAHSSFSKKKKSYSPAFSILLTSSLIKDVCALFVHLMLSTFLSQFHIFDINDFALLKTSLPLFFHIRCKRNGWLWGSPPGTAGHERDLYFKSTFLLLVSYSGSFGACINNYSSFFYTPLPFLSLPINPVQPSGGVRAAVCVRGVCTNGPCAVG